MASAVRLRQALYSIVESCVRLPWQPKENLKVKFKTHVLQASTLRRSWKKYIIFYARNDHYPILAKLTKLKSNKNSKF